MINAVRNSVLSVLNKNNYGYISPSDFNLYAKNAQMEMYEEYFSNYNKSMNMENNRLSGTDYADISKTIAEVLDQFLVYDYLTPVIDPNTFVFLNKYNVPNSVDNTFGESYMINKIQYYTKNIITGSGSSGGSSPLIDVTVDFIALGVSVGDVILNIDTRQFATITSVSTNAVGYDIAIFPAGIWAYSIYSSLSVYEAERVTNGKIDILKASPLTSPSILFPAYTQTQSNIILYPNISLNSVVPFGVYPYYGAVKAAYFRYPKDPKWTYTLLSAGEPVFDPSQQGYQDFELPFEDEYKLVMKILQYCGISIRESEVAQFATMQEQHEQPTFSTQQ